MTNQDPLFVVEDAVTAYQTAENHIHLQYETHNNRITSPGKFEGEARYLPEFYAFWGDGGGWPIYCCDESCGSKIEFTAIEVSAGDITTFPELAGTHWVVLWEDDNGFVRECRTYAGDDRPICPTCDKPVDFPVG